MTQDGDQGSVELGLHGIRLSLQSDTPAFSSYVSEAMSPYLSTEGVGPIHVHSRLQWCEGPRPTELTEAFPNAGWDYRPDRDIYVDGNSAYWLRVDDFLDLHLRVEWDGRVLSVLGRYYFQLGKGSYLEQLRKLRYRGRMDKLRAHRFSTLLYYLVYHPVLWRLSRFEGLHVLHGGAVSGATGAAVFAGMPGCGKSTLAVAMLADESFTMLSDNLVLHDGHSLLACPELLLLDPASIKRAGSGARGLAATGERRVFGRDAYRPSRTELGRVRPAAVFVVRRGRTSGLVACDPDLCCRHILAGNTMAKEVRRIAIMAEVLDLVAGTSAPEQAADLRSLLAGVPCFELRVGPDDSLDGVVAEYVMPALSQGAVGLDG